VRLLGVLLGIGIALALTLYVAGRVSGESSRTLARVPTTASTTAVSAPGATGAPGPPAVAAARGRACAADERTVSTAEEAYRAVEGHYADLPTLVTAGYLRAAPAALTVTLAPDASGYRLGGC